MSQNLPNMMENTIAKIREMVDVNSVIGTPITTPEGVTIIPISKVSVGFGGGGSDFSKPSGADLPFGGGMGGGVKVTPIAFLVIKGESVRMLPVASAPNTTTERIAEMLPDLIDKVSAMLDKKNGEKAE